MPAAPKTSEGATSLGAGLGGPGLSATAGCGCFLPPLRSTACRHLTALHRLSIKQFVSEPSCAQWGGRGRLSSAARGALDTAAPGGGGGGGHLGVQTTVLLVVEAPHGLARARTGRVDAVHVARHRLERPLGFLELGRLDQLVLDPVAHDRRCGVGARRERRSAREARRTHAGQAHRLSPLTLPANR